MNPGEKVAVLLAAGAAGWEPAVLDSLAAAAPRVALVKRCLDLTDLLSTAATGAAQVAVVSGELPGLDADAVQHLRRHGAATWAVLAGAPSAEATRAVDPTTRLHRLGVSRVVEERDARQVGQLLRVANVVASTAPELARGPGGAGHPEMERDEPTSEHLGRVLAVWGPPGAPGRTTLALGIAAEAAARGVSVCLVDADPYAGSLGQHLGMLEEVSGLLATARAANAGELDAARLARTARQVTPGLRLLTGLPRPDRWTELRPQALVELLGVARALDDLVVVDCGFPLPEGALDPFAVATGRGELVGTVLAEADLVLAIGTPDPVGITRLARALPDLQDLCPQARLHLVVNRMRRSMGWSSEQVAGLLESLAPGAPLSFLADDPAGTDRALATGRLLRDCGDGALRRDIAALTDAVVGPVARTRAPAAPSRRRARRSAVRATALRRPSRRRGVHAAPGV